MKHSFISLLLHSLLIIVSLIITNISLAQYSPTPTRTPTPVPTLGVVPNQTRTCNTNGTATFTWSNLAGASSYAFRLDYQGNPSSPIYNWYTASEDFYATTTSTSYTVAIQYNRQYQWGVSAFNGSGGGGAWNWNSQFTCPPPPTATATPYIQIYARNTSGSLVTVRGMSYTYDCGTWPNCFTTIYENVSSLSTRAVSGWEGGAGIALNSNQVILGVTPAPGGGSRTTTNNTCGNPWCTPLAYNYLWNHYWWPSYPSTGGRSVNFIVATMTPTPTPYCSDSDSGNNTGSQGTTTAWFTNGTSNSVTDACTGSIINGTYRSSVTEYSCQPPASGGSATGTTRTSNTVACASGYGCSGANGRCTCIPLSSPSSLSVATQDASGNVTPGSRTISWSAVTGASRYMVRIDDETSNGWSGNCGSMYSGDYCNNNITGTSLSYNFVAGRSYRVWVHAASDCTYSTPATLITRQTPWCSDNDGGNVPNTSGTTTVWPVGSSSTTNPDTCGTTYVSGSQSMTTTVTEYACQPPATGGSTGTSLLTQSVSCAAGRACFNGACILTPDLTFNPDANPDIVRNCVANGTTGTLTTRYCNTGAAAPATNNTFRIRYTRTSPLPQVAVTTAPIAMPAAGACTTINQTISTGTFGVTCDAAFDIQVHLDATLNVPESNDNNNISTFNGPALPGEVFYQLRNASLHRLRAIDVPIPNSVTDLDGAGGDYTADELFIIGPAGVVTSVGTRTRILPNNNWLSTNNFRKDDSTAYTETSEGWLGTSPFKYSEYAKAQKKSKTINNTNQITDSDTVYIWNGAVPVTLPANITANNVVIVVPGNVNLTGPIFNTSVNSVAIISNGTIAIPATANTVNAILIANRVTLGNSNTTRLKIKGNLIVNNPANVIDMAVGGVAPRDVPGSSPNLFVVVDPIMYMNLLPHISEITLQGRQVE